MYKCAETGSAVTLLPQGQFYMVKKGTRSRNVQRVLLSAQNCPTASWQQRMAHSSSGLQKAALLMNTEAVLLRAFLQSGSNFQTANEGVK